MTGPLVSIVLPVYNGARYLREAIESALAQTYHDFEFIIINDGSTDNSLEILRGIKDRRIRLYDQENKGLADTLNIGIFFARGAYIARMDQDDLALASRIEKQVSFMEKNPRCALLGTRAEIWVGDKRTVRFHDHPTDSPSLKFELMFDNYFVHSSVMLRKSALDDVGNYTTNPSRQPPEDYELWSRIARKYDIANLPERLTIYREVEASMSRVTVANPFLDKLVLISSENIAYELGTERSADIVDLAALIHSADNYLSRHPNIKNICHIVKELGRKISNGSSTDVIKRSEARIELLKYKYALHHLEGDPYRTFIRILKGIKRRIGFNSTL